MRERTLQPGDRVGPYTITDHLGSGGMGEVYRARDPRLGRSLALKVLPSNVAGDSVRRFMLEAQAASALNHPHILSIFEFGQIEGLYYIAMELVEGETLRAHVVRRTPLSKLLSPLAQVADGLARAHASGLVHRDLKPENVIVTHDGYAKILDFGLAKLIDPDSGPVTNDSDTAKFSTQTGAVLGTVGYMSPEQVLRAPLDGRSDIFALGCILHELASGRQPFAGETMIDTLHKIVYDAPAPLPATVDPAYAQLVMRCLAKKPDDRIAGAREVAEALRAMERSSGSAPIIAPHITEILPATVKRRGWRRALVAIAVILFAGAAGLLVFRRASKPKAAGQAVVRLKKLTNHGRVRIAEIAPDGKYIAQVVEDGDRDLLVLRHVATQSEQEIASEELGTLAGVTFGADLDHLYYVVIPKGRVAGALYRLPLLGGAKVPLFDGVSSRVRFAGTRAVFIRAVGDDDTVVMIGDLRDGTARPFVEYRTPAYLADVDWDADGRNVAFILGDKRLRQHDVVVMSPAAKEVWRSRLGWAFMPRLATLPGADFLVAGKMDESDRIGIWRLPRDQTNAVRLTDDVSRYNHISATADGKRLVTVQFGRSMNILVAGGTETRQVTQGAGDYYGVAWPAPNVVLYATDSAGSWDIWETDIATGRSAPLTRDGDADFFPDGSPDFSRVVFVSSRGGERNVWEIDRGTRKLRQLTTGQGENFPRYAPDGQRVIYTSYGKGIYEVRAVANGDDKPLSDERAIAAEFSADGKALAVVAQDPWRIEIGARTIDLPPSFSEFGGIRWRGDGKAIFYIAHEDGIGNVWEVRLADGARRMVTNFKSGTLAQFDLEPDGERLVVIHGVAFSDAVMMTVE